MMRLALAALLALLVVGCGQDPVAAPSGGTSDDPAGDGAAGEQEDGAAGEVLEGTLGGDPQLEGGCAWLEADGQRYEVFYPRGYQIAFEPLRLLGPDSATVAEEGDTVRVRGKVAEDKVSVCQIGTLYQADEVVE